MANSAVEKRVYPVEIIIDNSAACENVSRMAKEKGLNVVIHTSNNEFTVVLSENTNKE